MVDMSLDSEIVVTFGCQVLSRHSNTLIFSSALSNSLPKPMRRLTIWVNLFYTSAMDSPCCILNSSYSCIKASILALFTSLVPSCVTSSTSHISLALLILRDSKELIHVQWRCENVLYGAIILSSPSFLFYPFSLRILNLFIINHMYRSVRSIQNCILNTLVNLIQWRFYSNFPKLLVDTTKHRWPMYRSTFYKKKLVFSHFK